MGRSIYRYYKRTITSGQTVKVSVFGRFLTLLSNTGTANILLSVAGQGEEEFPAGLSVELPGDDNFTILEFRNGGGVPVTIEFSISSGRIIDNRFVSSSTLDVNSATDTIATPVKITVPTTAPGAPQVAANTARREIIIQNQGANIVWVGDANVDGVNSRGIKIPVDGTLILSTSAAIYLRATTGSTDVSVMEMTK